MKKLLLTLVLFFSFFNIYSQIDYKIAKGILIGQGFKIATEQVVQLKQDEHGFMIRTLYAGNQYKIFALSEHPDVQDLDILLYDLHGNLIAIDEDNSKLPILDFYCDKEIIVKIVVYNYKTIKNTNATVRLCIGYK